MSKEQCENRICDFCDITREKLTNLSLVTIDCCECEQKCCALCYACYCDDCNNDMCNDCPIRVFGSPLCHKCAKKRWARERIRLQDEINDLDAMMNNLANKKR